MDFKLSQALGPVKSAVMDLATKSATRRLNVYGQEVPCKAGCSACCRRLIRTTVAEAILMYEQLVKSGEWPGARVRAREQLGLAKDAAPLSWFKMNLPCPVLNQERGTCRAYSVRPGACSSHFVKSPPASCDPWGTSSTEYSPVTFLELVEEFRKRMRAALEGFGILSLELPLPMALLLAERVNSHSGVSVESAIALIYNEL